MRICVLFCILLSVGAAARGQALKESDSPLAIGPSYRIYPGEVTQSEVFIANDPLDRDVLFVTCNTISFVPFFISEGIYVSEDNGLHWRGSDTCNGYPIGFHGGDPGMTIDKNGTFILTRLGRTPFVGLYSHYSTDRGRTWSAQTTVSTDDLERAALASDAVKSSVFSGRTYAVWVTLSQPFPLMFSYTDDGGQDWSAARQVNDPSGRCAGGDVAVGPGGRVYACWAGVTSVSPFREIFVGVAASADGGDNWDVTGEAFPVNGITGLLEEKGNIRVNGLPLIAVDTTNGPRQGWIYIVTGQKDLAPAGSDPDIILYRSTDGGASWSPGIRVNQDPLDNGKIQYFPNIHVDRSGAVNVLFYDDRTTTTDSAGVFLARSTDGGDTWQEYEITDHHFKPAAIGGLGQGYQGDVIDLTTTETKMWPVWMDNSSGMYQVWTAPVDLEGLGFEEPVDRTGESLLTVYPNPFSQRTTIRYRVTKPGPVSLTVYDILGYPVSRLVNELKSPGSYEVIFDLAGLGPGQSCFYYCRFQAGDQAMFRKLIGNR